MCFFAPALADGVFLKFEWQHIFQVSKTLLGILADLDNAVVWIVSARLPISNSSTSPINLCGIVPSAQIRTNITVSFMFYSCYFFQFLARSRYLSHLFFIFTLWPTETAKSTIRLFLSLLLSLLYYFYYYYKIWNKLKPSYCFKKNSF